MSDETPISKEKLLLKVQQCWDEFQTYLKTLTETQLTQQTDAAGWTIKDHIMHLAVWEDGLDAVLHKLPRRERMGVDQASWDLMPNFDPMNAVIQKQHQDKSLAEVLATFQTVHDHVIARVRSMSDEDLHRPYRFYQPDSDGTTPIYRNILMDTCGHYAEHRPWMEAIATHGRPVPDGLQMING